MMTDIDNLQSIAKQVRRDILNQTHLAGSGHPGGSLSCTEILVTLYCHIMKHDPSHPRWADRDRFVLSKGHAAPALYAVLAHCGYFSRDELITFRKLGSVLQGHPDFNTPGIDVSTGSLGQGLSIANGIALAAKMDDKKYRTFVILGDGECDEGQVWEAAMLSSQYRLDNLCAIIDRNQFQIDNMTEEIMALEPLAAKWESFGWNVITVNGHNFPDLISCLNFSRALPHKPTMIIANTIKGRGISFMECQNSFHGRCLTTDEMKTALLELEGSHE
jgi:transketolase